MRAMRVSHSLQVHHTATALRGMLRQRQGTVIMQTYVDLRSGNDPVVSELRQSIYSAFELCRCAVAHMMRTASRHENSKPMTNRLERYQQLFSTLPANDTRSRTPHTGNAPVSAPKRSWNFRAFRWSFALQDWLSRIFSWPQTLLLRFLSSVVGERRSRWSTSELIFAFFRPLRRVSKAMSRQYVDVESSGRTQAKSRTTSCPSFLVISPSLRSLRYDDSQRKAMTQIPASHDRRPQSCMRWIYSDPPTHPVCLRVDPCAFPWPLVLRSQLFAKDFDKLPLFSTRGSCFQRKSSLSRQNSRSFQGSFWFLQFSRLFQDLENGFRNSSTFQGFQGPYAPWHNLLFYFQ